MQQRQLNNYHLDSVSGKWTKGTVKGRLMEKGWGADLGFPRMVLDDSVNCVDVFVLEASNLPVMSCVDGSLFARLNSSICDLN